MLERDTQRVEAEQAGPCLFVAGDGAGHLRGLVPSFVSGFCAGEAASHRVHFGRVLKEYPFGKNFLERPAPLALTDLENVDKFFQCTPNNPYLLFEVHIFLAPLNPDESTRQRYYDAIEVFNAHMPVAYGRFWKPMKGPFLALKFGESFVNVMQSARYVYGLSYREVLARAYEEDAQLFAAAGFDILRVKIELSMHGSRLDSACFASHWKHRLYSEHHLRVFHSGLEDAADPTDEELAELDTLAQQLERSLGLTVALSFNRKPHESSDSVPGKKRFLNVRFRGFDEAGPALNWVSTFYKHLEQHSKVWKRGSAIDEWVVFDSLPSMDRGWIDPKQNVMVICSAEERALIRNHAQKIGVSVHECFGSDDLAPPTHVGLVLTDKAPQKDGFIVVRSSGDLAQLFRDIAQSR